MDNQERRRGHFHRGRRGPDRRGPERSDRRTPPPQGQESSGREHGSSRDHVDVEQIMRDIRARIAQRHGIDLSNQQIQELASRRLEAILDPRSVKPGLLDELRRSAGTPAPAPDPAETSDLSYSFEDTTLYESHRGVLVFFRRLFNPLLKLFFNPNPLIRALNIQARWNAEMARKLAERDRRQTEWNALHYELVQRMVTEVAKVSLELQALAGQMESLSAKVDFNERRVRSMEAGQHQTRPAPRIIESTAATGAIASEAPSTDATTPEGGQPAEGTRRRRRRRRGRRGSGGAAADGTTGAPQQGGTDGLPDNGAEGSDDAGGDDDVEESAGAFSPAPETAMAAEPAPAPAESVTALPAESPVAIETHSPDPVPGPDPAAPAPVPEQREPQG